MQPRENRRRHSFGDCTGRESNAACVRVRVKDKVSDRVRSGSRGTDIIIYIKCNYPSVTCQRYREGTFHVGFKMFQYLARLAKAVRVGCSSLMHTNTITSQALKGLTLPGSKAYAYACATAWSPPLRLQ